MAIAAIAGSSILSTLAYTAVMYGIMYLTAPKAKNRTVNREGTKLSASRLTNPTADYGTPITMVYGRDRVSGTYIFVDDVIEHSSASSVTQSAGGGKGGGGGGGSVTTNTTTYTYTQTVAIALCEGPIVGVSKIWAGSNIIYNMSSDADGPTHTKAVTYRNSHLTFYLGTETQLPDPNLTAAETVAGTTPAYRGVAYVVINDYDITRFGGLPPFTFEVVTEGVVNLDGTITPSDVAVTTIVSSLTTLANIPSNLVDVSTVSSSISGLSVVGSTDLDSTLRPVLEAMSIGFTESGGKLIFKSLQNLNPVYTIPETELIVTSDSKPVIDTTIEPYLQLPSSLVVKYIGNGNNYQQAAQMAFDPSFGNQGNDVLVDINLVLPDNTAKTIADTLMRRATVERISYVFTLPFKYVSLDPYDVIRIPELGQFDVLLISTEVGLNGRIKCQGVRYDKASYTNTSALVSTPASNNQMSGLGTILHETYNLPPTDPINSATAGMFVAAENTGTLSTLFDVYVSVDNGMSYSSYTTITSAVTGTLDTAIPPLSYDTIDYNASVDVTFTRAFSPVTTDFNGIVAKGNSIVIRDEVLQFMTATPLTAANSYRLTGLIRGRVLTESLANVTHNAGTMFAMLDSINYVNIGNTLVNTPILYKIVPNGAPHQSYQSVLKAFTGKNILPPSPASVDFYHDATTNTTLHLTWSPRSLTEKTLKTSGIYPPSFTSEEFYIDIYDINDVYKATKYQSGTAHNYSYTAAERLADIGNSSVQFKIVVYQHSVHSGNGVQSEKVIITP